MGSPNRRPSPTTVRERKRAKEPRSDPSIATQPTAAGLGESEGESEGVHRAADATAARVENVSVNYRSRRGRWALPVGDVGVDDGAQSARKPSVRGRTIGRAYWMPNEPSGCLSTIVKRCLDIDDATPFNRQP